MNSSESSFSNNLFQTHNSTSNSSSLRKKKNELKFKKKPHRKDDKNVNKPFKRKIKDSITKQSIEDDKNVNKPLKRKINDSITKQSIEDDIKIKNEYDNRIIERNKRTLYIRFPENTRICNHDEIRSIVPSALSYRVPNCCNRNTYFKYIYAEFKSEDETLKELSRLKELKFPSGSLTVDRLTINPENNVTINPYRLYVNGIPWEASDEELSKVFPHASQIYRNKESKFRNKANFRTIAYLNFNSIEEARKTFWESKNLSILNKPLLVLYAEVKNKNNNFQKKKKLKVAK